MAIAAVVVGIVATCIVATTACGAVVGVARTVGQRVVLKSTQRAVLKHIKKETLRYGPKALKTGAERRSYQSSSWAQKQIVKYGKRSVDPREKGFVNFTHRGAVNGKSGTFRMTVNPRSGVVRHFGFERK